MLQNRANDHFGSSNGTTNYYKHPLGLLYTDGIKELSDACQSYWILDVIISHQIEEKVKREHFQVWDLHRTPNSSCDIIATDGNSNIIASQQIPYTDFPYQAASFWLVDGLILLPCEY